MMNCKEGKILKSRNEGKILIILIATLICFGLGSGIGINMGISSDDVNQTNANNTTIAINVTHNISAYENNTDAYYDPLDDTDYNENKSNNISYDSIKYYTDM
jgi:hypothetical protein